MMDDVKDMTINHKCSCCGNCCGLFIPFTEKELSIIKKYVKEHNIQPTNRITDKGFEAHCCFYDKENKKCNIYEVRPYVCKNFKCDHKDWLKRRNKYEKHGKYNSTINKQILATFDDKIYSDYEPVLRYVLSLSTTSEGFDSNILIRLLIDNNRLDLLDHFNGFDNKNKKITGKQMLKDFINKVL